jgi:hypothetical protein
LFLPGRPARRLDAEQAPRDADVQVVGTPSGRCRSDSRPPVVTEDDSPLHGYRVLDLPLAREKLVSDVAAAERTWSAARA